MMRSWEGMCTFSITKTYSKMVPWWWEL